jgi:hypothetical protein
MLSLQFLKINSLTIKKLQFQRRKWYILHVELILQAASPTLTLHTINQRKQYSQHRHGAITRKLEPHNADVWTEVKLKSNMSLLYFIVAWLCAVWRRKGTGHPTPFNSWLSTPRGCGMGCAVCVFMSVCLHVHVQVYACACVCGYARLVPALYEDSTSLRAHNCTYIHIGNFRPTLRWRHWLVVLRVNLWQTRYRAIRVGREKYGGRIPCVHTPKLI